MRMIVVTADTRLASSLARECARAGTPATTHGRAADVLLEPLPSSAGVVVVDWLLPDEPGIELCRRLRASSCYRSVPIVLLVGSCNEADKQLAMASGANAILLKPCSLAELMACVGKVAASTAHGKVRLGELSVGGIELDLSARVARYRGRPVHLGAVDARILEFLMRAAGRVVSRREILAVVWTDNAPSERAVDVYVSRLRRALCSAWNVDPIRTARGKGYGLGVIGGRQRIGTAARRPRRADLGASQPDRFPDPVPPAYDRSPGRSSPRARSRTP